MIQLKRSRLIEQDDGTFAMTVTLMPHDVAAFLLLSPTCDDAFFAAEEAGREHARGIHAAPEFAQAETLPVDVDDAAMPVDGQIKPPVQGIAVGGTDSMQGLFASPRGDLDMHIDLGRLCHHAPFQRYIEELRPVSDGDDSLGNAIKAMQSMSNHADFLHFYVIWHAQSPNAHENPFPSEVMYAA